ncbi:GGDEF domain-containing protein [Planosporangium sp. 12N6]|uniref:GGDEF domain-containing protein n=1 Tax=Planosporangium spinosum TaxID=3402278 RepID=UPI003CFB5649
MRWPTRTAPAAIVHAGFLVTAGTVTVLYALAGDSGRTAMYALVTAVPIITFLTALRADHLPDRWPWRIAVGGLAMLAGSNLIWPTWITDHHLGRAEGSLADIAIATAHLIFLIGSGAALRRHAATDFGGILDAAMVGLCCGGPIWEWVIRPRLGDQGTALGQLLLLTDVLILCGVAASLARIGLTARRARGPLAYMILCSALTVLGIATAVVTVHGTSLWTAEFMMLGYLTLAAAPVHPAAPYCTQPQPTTRLTPCQPRFGWLGVALCVNPLIAAVQTLRGTDGQSLLLPIGSLLVVPLVLMRFQLLSTQRAAAERTLAHHASHDELTGLYNRRHIVAEIDHALEEVDRGDLDGIAVVLCDLDGFKPVNDRLGHRTGDAVLQAIASRLVGCVRRGDIVGRLGGDEFLILCRGEPEQAVQRLQERISDAIAAPVRLSGVTVTVGVTMGAAVAVPGSMVGRDALIGTADATMYAGKAQRRYHSTVPPVNAAASADTSRGTALPRSSAPPVGSSAVSGDR